eukprot:TRINITY_DN27166_c0_g1_i1.p1 TRINITY_DN27166_c0_g1~~TRINITY_DN27166_c0_g1_i1.p1  ORF type:complete len:296 (-),score=53.68 TRINITY_DN27166_c0_g1_i1:51-938(-)
MVDDNDNTDIVLREALLRDPAVQNAVKKAGTDALSDPKVQRQIVAVCQEKFPEAADAVAVQVAQWAKDPVIQERAISLAGTLASQTADALAQAPGRLLDLIERGPPGLKILAFASGVAQCVLSSMSLLGFILGLGILMHPFFFMLVCYQFVFSLWTFVLEAPVELTERIQWLERWQHVLMDTAQFLSRTLGRGAFYLFSGILWVFEADFLHHPPTLIVGMFTFGVGVLHILVGFGFEGKAIARKLRDGGQMVCRASLAILGGADSPPDSARTIPLRENDVELAETKRTHFDTSDF